MDEATAKLLRARHNAGAHKIPVFGCGKCAEASTRPRCPSCGAVLNPGAHKCHLCKAWLDVPSGAKPKPATEQVDLFGKVGG